MFDWNLLQSSAHGCGEAGGKVSYAATGGDVFLDQPEKRRKRRIAVLRLRIVDGHPLVFDAKGNPAAVIDAKRLAYRLGHGRLSLGRDRARLFDDCRHNCALMKLA